MSLELQKKLKIWIRCFYREAILISSTMDGVKKDAEHGGYPTSDSGSKFEKHIFPTNLCKAMFNSNI